MLETTTARDSGRTRAVTPLICLFFLASGFSALIYQVAWVRILSVSFGTTIYAISAVLTIFMAGLALGELPLRTLDRPLATSSPGVWIPGARPGRLRGPARSRNAVDTGDDGVVAARQGSLPHLDQPDQVRDRWLRTPGPHDTDGRDAARAGEVRDAIPSDRRQVAGLALWLEHAGSGVRIAGGRLRAHPVAGGERGHTSGGFHQCIGRAGFLWAWRPPVRRRRWRWAVARMRLPATRRAWA